MNNTESYGNRGFQNPSISNLNNSEIIKQTEYKTYYNDTIYNQLRKKTLFTKDILPAKILKTKYNKEIIDNKVKALPLIYSRDGTDYSQSIPESSYKLSNSAQGYSIEGQGNQLYENTYQVDR